jgi:hypothetical protein
VREEGFEKPERKESAMNLLVTGSITPPLESSPISDPINHVKRASKVFAFEIAEVGSRLEVARKGWF